MPDATQVAAYQGVIKQHEEDYENQVFSSGVSMIGRSQAGTLNALLDRKQEVERLCYGWTKKEQDSILTQPRRNRKST
jgi:hypothetical protein